VHATQRLASKANARILCEHYDLGEHRGSALACVWECLPKVQTRRSARFKRNVPPSHFSARPLGEVAQRNNSLRMWAHMCAPAWRAEWEGTRLAPAGPEGPGGCSGVRALPPHPPRRGSDTAGASAAPCHPPARRPAGRPPRPRQRSAVPEAHKSHNNRHPATGMMQLMRQDEAAATAG
jgi:hypothetical protein